jgi:hypothetical protein
MRVCDGDAASCICDKPKRTNDWPTKRNSIPALSAISSLEQREIEVVDAVTTKAAIDTRFTSESPNRGCGEAVHVKPFIQSAVQLKQREMATVSKSRHLPKTQTSDRTG